MWKNEQNTIFCDILKILGRFENVNNILRRYWDDNNGFRKRNGRFDWSLKRLSYQQILEGSNNTINRAFESFE
jgi:hypothetical protein